MADRMTLLDIGGVLVHVEPARARGAFSRATGLPPEALDASLFDSGLKARCDNGDVTLDELPDVWGGICGAKLTPQDVRSIFREILTPNTETIALLPWLATLGPLGIVSNIDPIHHEQTMAFVGGPALFACQFISWRMGVSKPADRFYEMVAAGVGRPASDCIFVDDREDNIAAAALHGFAVHRFSDARSLERAARLFHSQRHPAGLA